MTKKQKKTLKRIIAAAVLTVLLALLFHFVELPWFVQLVLWLVPYLVIGHDVLRKAFMGIKNGEVFDENFLMAVATVGAIGCGETVVDSAIIWPVCCSTRSASCSSPTPSARAVRASPR